MFEDDDLLWQTATLASRSVAATGAAALIRHKGSPEVEGYFDARRNLDPASIALALESLAELDPALKTALQARQRLGQMINGGVVE
jgi:hypothetical protein